MAMGELGHLWNVGAIDTLAVATALAEHIGAPVERVRSHMDACCRRLRFHSQVMAFAR
ncbi:MAG TPA: hypothetical protein VG248_03970 [Caulobacteraceae bacterium]|jgi:hypothetical protein|nr:hypothetical protein [Caulobacteraceae bacterium]